MCSLAELLKKVMSLAVSTLDSPAVEPRSNPGSGKLLMSENLRLYTTSPVVKFITAFMLGLFHGIIVGHQNFQKRNGQYI